MRRLASITLAAALLSGGLAAAPARADNSTALITLSGSVSPTGSLWFRVTNKAGVEQRTVTAALTAGQTAANARDGLVQADILGNPVKLSASGASALVVTYGPGTNFRCWVSTDNTTYTEIVTGAAPIARGITFTDTGSMTHAVTTPAMDAWGLLALVLTLGAGGWFMLRRLGYERAG